MIRQVMTYVLEGPASLHGRGDVLGYYKRLGAATDALACAPVGASVLALRGSVFGEGWHRYRVRMINGKPKRGKAK